MVLASSIKGNVKKYSNYTYDLLHLVYSTKPMKNAAPGELLQFTFPHPEIDADEAGEEQLVKLTSAQKRKLKELKVKLRAKKQERKKTPADLVYVKPATPPDMMKFSKRAHVGLTALRVTPFRTIQWCDLNLIQVYGDPLQGVDDELA